MKINKPKIEEEQDKKKQLGWKTKLTLVLLGLLIVESLGFFAYYSYTRQNLQTALQQQERIEQLNQEVTRCNQVISQGQGEFAQYEYCTQMLNTFK